jgi:hypothetical protein
VKITDINFWLQPEFLNELGFFWVQALNEMNAD